LLLSSLSGNFLQDPVLGKRYLLQFLGAAWLALGLWTLTQLKGDRSSERKVEEELASLKGPL